VLTTMLMGLVRELDFREIVLEQLSTGHHASSSKMAFRQFSDDKLSFITLLGGLLGLVGGTVLVWPFASMLVLAVLFGLLVAIDLAIYPLMRSRYYPKRRGRPRGLHAPSVESAAARRRRAQAVAVTRKIE
jgi:MFS family permease